MKKENGVYTTPCTVNGLKLRFIFDTGASNVSISLTEAIFMLKNGYLDESDLHGSSYTQIANGDIIENTSVILREIEIAGLKLYNIKAIIIHELSAPLLFGQSAIEQLGTIQIEENNLVIIDANSPSSKNSCLEAENLIKEAIDYSKKDLNNLAAETYQDAYDMCPSSLNCRQIDILGELYYHTEQFSLAIRFFNKAEDCLDKGDALEKIFLKYNYYYSADSYKALGEYDNAIIYFQKALSLADDEDDKSSFNSMIGSVYHDKKNYNEALRYYKISIEYYLSTSLISPEDVFSGDLADRVLGEKYWNVASCYYMIDNETKSDSYMIRSALCGYGAAIDFCNKFGIDFKSFVE